jgi:hypothetical protein
VIADGVQIVCRCRHPLCPHELRARFTSTAQTLADVLDFARANGWDVEESPPFLATCPPHSVATLPSPPAETED